MRKSISPFLSSLLFLLFLTTNLTAQIMQYENQLIDQLNLTIVQGDRNEEVQAGALKGRLKTREGDFFSQAHFDGDLKMLAEEYDRIEPSIQVVNQKLRISIRVWPKPKIRSILWEGNHGISTSRLQKELGISANSVFNRQAFHEAFNSIKALYVKKGFFEAEIEYCVERDPETNEVDIRICIDEGRAGTIKKVVFHNFQKCEERELRAMIHLHRYYPLTSWLTEQGMYKDEAVRQDEYVILNYLQNRGYADAKVSIQLEEIGCNRIIVNITADRGDRYSFGNITFEGNELFSDEDISRYLCVGPCDPYSTEKVHDMMRALMDYYGRRGYLDTIVNYEPKLIDGECVYDIHVTIDEGEQYRVGLIKIFGNHLTCNNILLHEIILCPGDIFNTDLLKITERRLCNIGYFDSVNVYAVASDGLTGCAGNYRDVHIEVVEGSTGSFGAFGGFSTNESVFGGFNITEKNFNILGLGSVWRDGLRALRGAGEYAHFTTTIGKKSLSYVFSWTKPYFMDTPWSIGFDVESSRSHIISDDTVIYAVGFSPHASYIINPWCKTSLHYRFRDSRNHLDGSNGKVVTKKDENGVEQSHVEHKYTPLQRREANISGIVSAFGTTWLYDSTNHPFIPTCGYKSRFEAEIAGIGGDFQFLSFAYLNKYFYDLNGWAVLKVRADFRFIQPIKQTGNNDLPLDERLYLGGDYTVRGYRSYELGPQFDDSNDPRGGLSLVYGSAEIGRCAMGGLAEGFFFYDVGGLELDPWTIGNTYHSVGIGARLQVMGAGSPPLTIGYGIPLNPARKGDVKKFFLTAGGFF